MVRGRVAVALAAALCVALALAGCNGKDKRRPVTARSLAPTSPYEKAVVADGATALWSFRDATGLSARDEVADLTAAKGAATVVGGPIAETTGPEGGPAAQFLRSGRVVTSVTTGLASTDAFSIELDLRADTCVSAWGRVLGTTTHATDGREGFELLHFPKQFKVSPCRFGVEFWHQNRYVGGCHPKLPPVAGHWAHWSVVYAKKRVSCYVNGTLFQSSALEGAKVFKQLGPLGLGGSGSGFQGPLDGASLGEVAFSRRALSRAEVERHARLFTVVSNPTASPRPS